MLKFLKKDSSQGHNGHELEITSAWFLFILKMFDRYSCNLLILFSLFKWFYLVVITEEVRPVSFKNFLDTMYLNMVNQSIWVINQSWWQRWFYSITHYSVPRNGEWEKRKQHLFSFSTLSIKWSISLT